MKTLSEENQERDITIQELKNTIETLQNELASSKEWKEVGSATRGTAIDISGIDFNELYVEVRIEDDYARIIPMIIPKIRLNSDKHVFRVGYYFLSAFNASAAVTATTSTITCTDAYNGEVSVSSSVMTVYYR